MRRKPAGAMGHWSGVEVSARALRDGLSGSLFYEGSVEDISQRHAAQEERASG